MKSLNIICMLVCSLFLTVTCGSQQSKDNYNQNSVSNTFQNRKAAVAGSFYPGNQTNLTQMLAQLFTDAQPQKMNKNVRALISPHAGYVFSGGVAASSFNQLDFAKKFKRVFVIGSSHHVAFQGASVYNRGNYETPLGEAKIDKELCDVLINNHEIFTYFHQAHFKEHSLEVQLPFLQYIYNENLRIVPIVIGSQNKTDCKKLAQALRPYFTDDNLFVISSDFSHYPNYKDAVDADQQTWEVIRSGNPEEFFRYVNKSTDKEGLVTRACGWSSILTLLYMTSETPDAEYIHLNYKNSGDSKHGDHNRVVGYHAAMVTEIAKKNETETGKKDIMKDNNNEFVLTKSDKELLLDIARATLQTYLQDKTVVTYDEKKMSGLLLAECGAFVTLHNKKELRGCIGRFVSDEPLYRVVQQMAISAATEDHRFSHVTYPELNDIDIEISVLTPLKRINSIDEFEMGKHGIYIIQGYNRGTFLPQVAHETGWTKEEFLGHCARDKARIGWDGWKSAELYTYEAGVFGEKELGLK